MGYSVRDAKMHGTQPQPLQIQPLPGPCFGPKISKASRDTTEIILLLGLFSDIANTRTQGPVLKGGTQRNMDRLEPVQR